MASKRMPLAYLLTRNQSVRLVQGDHGTEWDSDNPGLQEQANRFVPLNAIPESGGNPAAWAIHELEKYLLGETCVLATNISPVEKQYGRYYP